MGINIPEAVELTIEYGKKPDGATSSRMYIVQGMWGIFYRVSREGRYGLKTDEGNVLAVMGDDTLVELQGDVSLSNYLSEAFGLPTPTTVLDEVRNLSPHSMEEPDTEVEPDDTPELPVMSQTDNTEFVG